MTLTDVTDDDLRKIAPLGREFKGPDVSEQPFRPQIECVFDLPVPPSVNRTRKIDFAGRNKVEAWQKHADALVMASGQLKRAIVNIPRYELEIILDESKCKIDPDNGIKQLIDYLRRIEVIQNDAPKNARQILIKWGSAPEGVRVIVKPLEPEYDAQKDFAGSLDVGYAAIRKRMVAGGPGWTPKEGK